MSDTAIEHNEAGRRFETTVDGRTAYAQYERSGDVITFTHTIVPDEVSGQGVASDLVRAALDFARESGMRVVPRCSYVSTFIERHEEYQDLVDKG